MEVTVLKQTAQAFKKAGGSVVLDGFGGVSITVDGFDDSVYLQGDEAYSFANQAEALYDKVGVITMDDAIAFYAYDYLNVIEY